MRKNKLNYPKAHVDLRTGKVYGCPKGSWKWYHEKAHLIFNEDINKSFLIMLNGWASMWISVFIIFAFFIRGFLNVAIILVAYQILFGLYEEWWCNNYADKKYNY